MPFGLNKKVQEVVQAKPGDNYLDLVCDQSYRALLKQRLSDAASKAESGFGKNPGVRTTRSISWTALECNSVHFLDSIRK